MGFLDFSSLAGAWPLLLVGMATTLKITLAAMGVGMVMGTLLAVARLSSNRLLSGLATAYVTLFRSVPLVMVILWFYLIVPQIIRALFGYLATDIRLASAMTAFALFEAAYYAEIIRAGIRGIPRGQVDAALALGLTPGQTLRWVVLPQAFRNMIPPLLTQAIILFQDTSLVYVIGLSDFFGMAYRIGDRDGRLVELLLMAGGVYFLISLGASRLVSALQGRIRS